MQLKAEKFTESTVKEATLSWCEGFGYAIRAALLPKLLSGEIRMTAAGRFVEGAARLDRADRSDKSDKTLRRRIQ